MKRPKYCVVCKSDEPKQSTMFGVGYTGIFEVGLCDQCLADAAMGARARGMEYKNEACEFDREADENVTWNECLRKIKEGK
jgi:hypothetical protein